MREWKGKEGMIVTFFKKVVQWMEKRRQKKGRWEGSPAFGGKEIHLQRINFPFLTKKLAGSNIRSPLKVIKRENEGHKKGIRNKSGLIKGGYAPAQNGDSF